MNNIFEIGSMAESFATTKGSKNATRLFGKTGLLKTIDMRTRPGIFIKKLWQIDQSLIVKYLLKKGFSFLK
jgi:hypothetical protein